MKKVLRLFPFDKNFARLFAKEKNRLTKILGEKIAIEHVGSTAVDGLSGKGIIDIAVGVAKKSDLRPTADILAKSGYFFDLDNETPDDRIFLASREHDSTLGDYHLHVVVKNGDEWKRFIFFRDQLRASKKLREEYMNLKEKLFRETGANREKYKKLKNKFIEDTLEDKK